MKKILAAAIQLNSGVHKLKNIENASRLISEATQRGARLIALPELFNWNGHRKEYRQYSESIPGFTSKIMAELARSLNCYILGGSILETNCHSSKPYNTSFLLNPRGECIACYRKLHLFKINLGEKITVDERTIYTAGDAVVSASTPWGKVGFTICYDLRFPELYRSLVAQGVSLIFVPSSFTYSTGKVHWEILLRARAIENQVYIIAPNQYGKNCSGIRYYGHSLIVDPWGSILSQCEDGEGIIYAELDFDYLRQIRKQLPSLSHRRKDVFARNWSR